MTAKTTLFLYGTLKRGYQNHHFLAGQRFLREAVTLPRYRIYILGWHPGLVDDAGQGLACRGELWEVDEDALARMDDYEGHPHTFIRRAVAIQDYPEPVDAYFFNGMVPPGQSGGAVWPETERLPAEEI